MTLPVALLIACYKHESISHEIREIVGEKVSVLESLSCRCNDHVSRLHLVPPSSCCSSDTCSVISDTESTTSTNSANPIKSYSYFSEINEDEMLHKDCGAPSNVDLGRYLNTLVDLVENVTVRFKQSYIFKEDEIKINYEKRDILNLGKNIQGGFPLTHPIQERVKVTHQPPEFYIQKCCTMEGCDFQEMVPWECL